MSMQQTLPLQPVASFESRHDEMKELWIAYNKKHTRMWPLFVKFTFELINRGFKRHAGQFIIEKIRNQVDVPDAQGKPSFKISNDFVAFYTRKFMDDYPKYGPSAPGANDGFFSLRQQTSHNAPATRRPPLDRSSYA